MEKFTSLILLVVCTENFRCHEIASPTLPPPPPTTNCPMIPCPPGQITPCAFTSCVLPFVCEPNYCNNCSSALCVLPPPPQEQPLVPVTPKNCPKVQCPPGKINPCTFTTCPAPSRCEPNYCNNCNTAICIPLAKPIPPRPCKTNPCAYRLCLAGFKCVPNYRTCTSKCERQLGQCINPCLSKKCGYGYRCRVSRYNKCKGYCSRRRPYGFCRNPCLKKDCPSNTICRRSSANRCRAVCKKCKNIVRCLVNPCRNNPCKSHRSRKRCVENYCGGCNYQCKPCKKSCNPKNPCSIVRCAGKCIPDLCNCTARCQSPV